MSAKASPEEFPMAMRVKIRELHESIDCLKKTLQTLITNYSMIKASVNSDALKRAKFELTITYVINSLFWIYLTTKGVNPRERGIKDELLRLKDYMMRLKRIEDKVKAPKVDTEAVKRFVKHSLWDIEDERHEKRKRDDHGDERHEKRKRDDDGDDADDHDDHDDEGNDKSKMQVNDDDDDGNGNGFKRPLKKKRKTQK